MNRNTVFVRRPAPTRRGSAAGRLRGLAAVPAAAALGWLACSTFLIPHRLRLPPALPGDQRDMDTIAGRVSYYTAGPEPTTAPAAEAALPPLLLVHSVNAAASAYEVRPIYEAMRTRRPVYALDLPGFGFSERSPRTYTPRLMTDAIHAMVEEIRRIHGDGPVDAVALSLGCEFLARAAAEAPAAFRSLALVSPTGLDSRGPYHGPPGSTRGSSVAYGAFSFPVWGRAVYDLLNTRVSARYFLEKAWGSKDIDEGLWDYDYLTSHQPGAEHAPFYFVSGFLFSRDITRLYEQLQMPVLAIHGVRGDFVDYTQLREFGRRPNWTVKSFRSGAFPHFEMPGEFVRAYDAFLADAAASRAPAMVD
ncbi:alpha/beta fold hydrolase [Rhodoplanes serenus]|uniref:alpha/beta fold hydrolase n=1 Tax=Rhodoplanes serenus TaxID=200615 RepID=UPI000DAC1D71|nr:alpha/beta hydrolase [Rhodoplanes serenus]RAI35420.1 alpha/beta hydrolase [Rhodoplanes serenus]